MHVPSQWMVAQGCTDGERAEANSVTTSTLAVSCEELKTRISYGCRLTWEGDECLWPVFRGGFWERCSSKRFFCGSRFVSRFVQQFIIQFVISLHCVCSSQVTKLEVKNACTQQILGQHCRPAGWPAVSQLTNGNLGRAACKRLAAHQNPTLGRLQDSRNRKHGFGKLPAAAPGNAAWAWFRRGLCRPIPNRN